MDGKTELPVGSKITFEKLQGGDWKWHINVGGGGIIGQMGPHATITDAFEKARSVTTEE